MRRMTAYHLEDDKRRGGAGCADKKLKLNSTHESIATFMTRVIFIWKNNEKPQTMYWQRRPNDLTCHYEYMHMAYNIIFIKISFTKKTLIIFLQNASKIKDNGCYFDKDFSSFHCIFHVWSILFFWYCKQN